ncbi:MAG: dipeptidase [Pseudoxanthomonas sp.]
MKSRIPSKAVPLFAAMLLALATGAYAGTGPAVISEQAKAIHAKAINLDTHLDTPALFGQPGWKISDRHSFAGDGSQVDYPRMVEGGLDGGFWVVYTGQGPLDEMGKIKARDFGLKRLGEIREMVAGNADKFELATVAGDAARIKAEGKKSVYISMENAYPLSHDPSLLRYYFKAGLRMLSLVHGSQNDFADSSGISEGAVGEFGGLSEKGRQMIVEANKLGIIIDHSHASPQVFDQMIELSKAPIILSHSGAWDVHHHPRNLDDARLRKLAEHGGVIQVNSLASYLIDDGATPAYRADVSKIYAEYGGRRGLSPEDRKEAVAKIDALKKKYKIKSADFDDYMRHLLHILKVAGWQHVGLGADWDGGGGVKGYQEITELPKVTQALLDAGYNEEQIIAVLGGNTIRLIEKVQSLADPEAVKAALE